MAANEIKITNRIRQLRDENGKMTQSDLALKAGVTRQTIISLEAGRYSPSLELAYRVSTALESTVEGVFIFPGTLNE